MSYGNPMYQQPFTAQPQMFGQYPTPQQNMPMNQFQMPQTAPASQSMASPDDRIWVQGEDSAKAYLVAPSSFVRLWDSSSNRFYEKKADASGRPTMEVFEYTSVTAQDAPRSKEKEDAYNSALQDLIEKTDALERKFKALEKEVAGNVSKSNADDTDL